MEVIKVSELWKCETCFHMINGKCTSLLCDSGEDYRPALSKFTIYEIDDNMEKQMKIKK